MWPHRAKGDSQGSLGKWGNDILTVSGNRREEGKGGLICLWLFWKLKHFESSKNSKDSLNPKPQKISTRYTLNCYTISKNVFCSFQTPHPYNSSNTIYSNFPSLKNMSPLARDCRYLRNHWIFLSGLAGLAEGKDREWKFMAVFKRVWVIFRGWTVIMCLFLTERLLMTSSSLLSRLLAVKRRFNSINPYNKTQFSSRIIQYNKVLLHLIKWVLFHNIYRMWMILSNILSEIKTLIQFFLKKIIFKANKKRKRKIIIIMFKLWK